MVELRGIEPLTFSMRTRRATNCAIAPWSYAGYQPERPKVLLASRPRQVIAPTVGDLVEMLEDGILVVDIEHRRAGPPE